MEKPEPKIPVPPISKVTPTVKKPDPKPPKKKDTPKVKIPVPTIHTKPVVDPKPPTPKPPKKHIVDLSLIHISEPTRPY